MAKLNLKKLLFAAVLSSLLYVVIGDVIKRYFDPDYTRKPHTKSSCITWLILCVNSIVKTIIFWSLGLNILSMDDGE